MSASTPRSRHTFALTLGLVSSLLLAACGGEQPTGAAQAAETGQTDAAPAIPVEVATARQGSISTWYTGTGTLEARNEADAIAKVGGVVEVILVEEGDHVTKGQVLARLDDERLALELARARANLAKVEQEFARAEQMHERHLLSNAEFETQKYELAALKAALQLADLEHDWTTLRSPIDGIVATRHIKVGNLIEQNQPAFHIVDMTPLIAEVFVPETELATLHAGQTASISPQAMAEQPIEERLFAAHVERVSPVVDAATGTFKVTLQLDTPTDLLRPGMFVTSRIEQDQHTNAVLIPQGAVFDDNSLGTEQDAIFVVTDGVAHLQPVTLGITGQAEVEVTANLAPGALVVTVGQNSLRDGSKVNVINQPQTDATTTVTVAATTNPAEEG